MYKAENKLLFWLLIILGLLMLLAIAALIICCICPGCPFYMAPRKRRVYSSETLIARSNGRPKRHFRRKPMATIESNYFSLIPSLSRNHAYFSQDEFSCLEFSNRIITVDSVISTCLCAIIKFAVKRSSLDLLIKMAKIRSYVERKETGLERGSDPTKLAIQSPKYEERRFGVTSW